MDLNLAMEVIPYFRLTEKVAVQIIEEIKNSVSQWIKEAIKLGISNREIELKTRAFNKFEPL